MSVWDVVIPAVAFALGVIGTALITRGRRRAAEPPAGRSTIVFPFVGSALSERALQATLRIAWAEQAVVVPAYLATVPLPLSLDAPLARSCDEALNVFEAIEQRAAQVGVPVDGRIACGRNVRHALRTLIAEVPNAGRLVVAGDGFSVDDIAWLLRNAPGEVLVVRPGPAAPTLPRRDPRPQARRAA